MLKRGAISAAIGPLLPPGVPEERVTACIGLLSDTHMPERCAALPPALFTLLDGVDLILHAGDVGELWVLDQLSSVAPVVAVHGNDESVDAQRELPYQQIVTVAGRRVLLTHAHYPVRGEELASRRGDAWEPILRRRATMGRDAGAAVVVFGHTHVPMTYRQREMLLVNPGAIASGNFITRQSIQSAALLFLRDDGTPFVTHVDLSHPEQPFEPQIDWEASFSTALDQFSASILSPEVEALWKELRTAGQLAPDALHNAILRAAHRCWTGEQVVITKTDLLAELRAEPGVPATAQAQFETVLL